MDLWGIIFGDRTVFEVFEQGADPSVWVGLTALLLFALALVVSRLKRWNWLGGCLLRAGRALLNVFTRTASLVSRHMPVRRSLLVESKQALREVEKRLAASDAEVVATRAQLEQVKGELERHESARADREARDQDRRSSKPHRAEPSWTTQKPKAALARYESSDPWDLAGGSTAFGDAGWSARSAGDHVLLRYAGAWPADEVTVLSIADGAFPMAEAFGRIAGRTVLLVEGDRSGQRIHTLSVAWRSREGWALRADLAFADG